MRELALMKMRTAAELHRLIGLSLRMSSSGSDLVVGECDQEDGHQYAQKSFAPYAPALGVDAVRWPFVTFCRTTIGSALSASPGVVAID